jgi:hypothetical protein
MAGVLDHRSAVRQCCSSAGGSSPPAAPNWRRRISTSAQLLDLAAPYCLLVRSALKDGDPGSVSLAARRHRYRALGAVVLPRLWRVAPWRGLLVSSVAGAATTYSHHVPRPSGLAGDPDDRAPVVGSRCDRHRNHGFDVAGGTLVGRHGGARVPATSPGHPRWGGPAGAKANRELAEEPPRHRLSSPRARQSPLGRKRAPHPGQARNRRMVSWTSC